jgi:hypothetical protein
MLYIVEDFDIRVIKEGCTLTITPLTFNQAKNIVSNTDTVAVIGRTGPNFFTDTVDMLGVRNYKDGKIPDSMHYDTDLLVISKVDGEMKFWMVR